jgi:hypothetical protein
MLALLAAASIVTALDAERAFAADAQKLGQWTAFTKWSADDALMFVPQPVNAHQFLKDRKDPPVAVFWWPTKSFVSCDGATAINSGPWVRDGGRSVGYFTTVWKRHADGSWKWVYDGGDGLKEISAEGKEAAIRTASCSGKPRPDSGDKPNVGHGKGFSADGTLAYQWSVAGDGSREFKALLFNGTDYEVVLEQKVAAPR